MSSLLLSRLGAVELDEFRFLGLREFLFVSRGAKLQVFIGMHLY
jgi:hypothetical protein